MRYKAIISPLAPWKSPATAAASSRQAELDILKGLGIIFVIIGHMGSPAYGGNSILDYVYTFHIPLFFVVIGYLSLKVPQTNFGLYAKKRAKGLLLPYSLFFLFSLLWTNTVYPLSQGLRWFSFPLHPVDILKAFFLSGGYLEKIPLGNFPLWFLPLCFLACICFYWVVRIRDTRLMLAATLIIGLSTLPVQAMVTGRPAWHINALPAAVFFMLAGYLFRLLNERRNLKGNSFLAIVLIILGYMLSLGCGVGANIARINTYTYFASALVSVYGYYMLACESRNVYLEYIGRSSLYFFSLHALILQEIPVLKIDKFFINLGQDGLVVYAIQLLSVVLLTTVLVAVLQWLAGAGGLWSRHWLRAKSAIQP